MVLRLSDIWVIITQKLPNIQPLKVCAPWTTWYQSYASISENQKDFFFFKTEETYPLKKYLGKKTSGDIE